MDFTAPTGIRSAALLQLAVTVLVLSSCANSNKAPPTSHSSIPSEVRVADMQVVDCLLPGQLRTLGTSSYMTPRRPALSTAAECRLLGGEYVEYDRADYKTALAVWLPQAQVGDAEAQVSVGEIFERGVGGEPNYEAAKIWYEKAADQGSSRAQFNLGTLYEQGLGVARNKLTALNLYRQAWGLEEDNVLFQSAQEAELKKLSASLKSQLAARDRQINVLKKQVTRMRTVASVETAELAELQNLVRQLEADRASDTRQLAGIRVREPKVAAPVVTRLQPQSESNITKTFGKFYALIIGNANYAEVEDLETPLFDARRAKQILEQKYGFTVQLLTDADNVAVMQAVNDLNEVLTEKDNLLIFYAGHGSRVQTGKIESGYWLPVNADAPPNDTRWVSNEFITRHLARLKAKRVLVVADSCYAGLLSSAPGFLFVGDQPNYTDAYIKYKLPKRSRLLLSSGGDKPVLDNAGGDHSVFASALLHELEANDDILAGPELYLRVRKQVVARARAIDFKQEPQFKVIKGAGHEVGDFFFVPAS